MKILYSWLKEFIDIDLPAEELAKKFVEIGIEVASVEKKGADFEGVRVAHIKALSPHPNAEKLQLVDLETADGPQRVVCGAKNIAVGQKVPLAKVGARLGKNTLQRAEIRGIISEGMMCSADELGLAKDRQPGILILDENLEVGVDVSSLYGKPDVIFDLEITSNRPDLLSHLGIARELSVLFDKPVKMPAIPNFETKGEALKVEIKDPAGCPRYSGRLIRGVKNAQSPDFIKERLLAMGLNPKNALIDITNYVMFELGHPLHAFDRQEIDGDTVVIRKAEAGEKFTLLDGKELTLNPDCLLIADTHKATALAGIMGGLNSGIKPDTQDIFIESAYFEPQGINKTSKTFGVSSDSSQRFERGTDVDANLPALQRATDLFLQICGGTASEVVDVYAEPLENTAFTFHPQEINDILGMSLEEDELKKIFSRLAAKFETTENGWTFLAPMHRRDLNHKWDLAEEAARFAGYNRIPLGQSSAKISFADNPKAIDLTQSFARDLLGMGFYEAKNIDFLSDKELALFGFEPKQAIKIKNPLAKGWEYMRPTLLPALLKNIAFNEKHGQENLALFEISKVFSLIKNYASETYTVSGVLTGALEQQPFFGRKPQPADFYFLKGVLQNLLDGFDNISFETNQNPPKYMHPKICMDIIADRKKIGLFGKAHPQTLKDLDVNSQDIFVFEFTAKPLEKQFSALDFKPMTAPSSLPPSFRDLSVVLDKTVSYEQIQKALAGVKTDVAFSYQLIDVYAGERLPEGKKSVTFSLAFSNPERTLKDSEIDACFQQIVTHLNATIGAALR